MTAPPGPPDSPLLGARRRIVIVGGGVAGACLAIHLLANADAGCAITIVEPRDRLGHGPAYGTTDPAFRLNVPAERMSLFPARPEDFLDWANARGSAARPGDLLARSLFGRYVEERLADARLRSAATLTVHRCEATSADAHGVVLEGGAHVDADAVVLATGNQLPAAPVALDRAHLASPHLIEDPWSDAALARIAPDEEVLLVGTGLTAVDVLLALRNQGHRGQVFAVSRRGLLPRAHLAPDDPSRRPFVIDVAASPRTARGLLRWFRAEVARARADGVAWQSVVDALRPHTSRIWGELETEEKRRFMRKLRPHWDVVRHRAAPEALADVERWRRRGTLTVTAARIVHVAEGRDDRPGLTVRWIPRRGASEERCFDRVVLCTGPETDVRRWPAPLFRQLLRQGHIVPDALALGMVTDAVGGAVDVHGRSSSWLFTIGALRRPRLWETTAVPDIVQQAVQLADTLRSAPAAHPRRI